MNIVVLVILLMVVGLLVYFFVKHVRRTAREREFAERWAPLHRWLDEREAMKNPTDEQLARFRKPPPGWKDYPDSHINFRIERYLIERDSCKRRLKEKAEEDVRRKQGAIELTKELRSVQREADPVRRFEQLMEIRAARYHYAIASGDRTWMRNELLELVGHVCDRYLHEARKGDVGVFTKLRVLVVSYMSPYQQLVGDEYKAPSDWNELIAWLVPNPAVEDFILSDADPEPGATRRLAAYALSRENVDWQEALKDAKIVLAWCAISRTQHGRHGTGIQQVWTYRDEIGAQLNADLAKMVHRIEVKYPTYNTVQQEVTVSPS